MNIIFYLGDGNYKNALSEAQLLMRQFPEDATSYYYFCLTLKKMGKLDWGLSYFKKSLNSQLENPFFLYSIGLIYYYKCEYGKAVDYFEKCISKNTKQALFYEIYILAIDNSSQDERGVKFLENLYKQHNNNFYISSTIASIYFYWGIYPSFFKWLKITRKQNPDYFNTRVSILNALESKGKYKEAYYLSKKWARIYKQKGLIKEEALCLTYVMYYALSFNKYEEAFKAINKAYDLSRLVCFDDLIRYVESLYAYYYEWVGYFSKAKRFYELVISSAHKAKDYKTEADSLENLGDVYGDMGNFQGALDSYNKALTLAVKMSDRKLLFLAYMDLGDLNFALNEVDDALSYYLRALQIALFIHDPIRESVLYESIGNVYNRKKNYSKALSYFRKGIETAKKTNFVIQRANLFMDMSASYYHLKNMEKKDQLIDNAEKIYKKYNSYFGLAYVSLAKGYISFKAKNYEEAMKNFKQLLEYGRTLKDRYFTVYALSSIGGCYRKKGKLKVAIEYYKAAFSMIKETEASLQNLKEKIKFGSELYDFYEAIVSSYIELYEKEHNPIYIEKAFRYSEEAKAHNLAPAIAKSKLMQTIKYISPEAKMRLLMLNKKYESKHKEYLHLLRNNKGNDRDEIARTRAELNLLERERADYIDKMRKEFPRFFRFLEPKILTLDYLKKRISKDKAIIEYFVGKKNIYYWIIGNGSVKAGKIKFGAKSLNTILKKVSYTIFSAKQPSYMKACVRNARWAGINVKALHDLYNKIIHPFYKQIKGVKNIAIIPDGKLHYFPFEMLVEKLNSKNGIRYLVEDFDIDYIPFAGILSERNSITSRPVPGNVLLFADPVINLPSTSGIIHYHLPQSAIEAEVIANMIPYSKLFLGPDARKDNFKKYAPIYKVLHISTHNYIDDRQPFYTKLAFSAEGVKHEDDFLYTYEIFNMNLKSDLVVLSGCETGLGTLYRGEGIIGLTRAFLYAGASSVIVSLWPVSDSKSKLFMETFYTHLWNGQCKSAALRSAKLDMINKYKIGDPFFWAPFILIGDNSNIAFHRKIPINLWFVAIISLFLIITILLFLKAAFLRNRTK